MARAEVVRLGETGRHENVEAEAALLGALLIDNAQYQSIAGTISERDFAEPVHGSIFSAIAEAVSRGKQASPVLLRTKFEADEGLKELGGVSYLARLTADGSGLLALREIAEQIRELAQLRRLRDGAAEIAATCGRQDVSASDLVAQLQALTDNACEDGAFASLESLDLATLANIKPMQKAMAIERLAPAGEVTLMTGPGSAGKSLAGQQICTAAAGGQRFLGLTVIPTPALYLTAEDDAGQLHFRQEHICERLGTPMATLAGRLHLISTRGELDNALGTFAPDGTLAPTAAFHRLRAKVLRTGAKIVCLDNVAHTFAGNENDRGQVTLFVNLLNRLAGETGAAIILIAHPNKGGDSYSGSTAWLNALRSHITLDFERDGDGEVLDPDARVLTVSKANYSRKGEAIKFRWLEWCFVLEEEVPEGTRAELADVIRASTENRAFLRCLAACTNMRRAVSHNPGSNYAAKVFAGMPEGKGHSAKAFAAAMERLLHIGQIELDVPLWQDAHRHWKSGIRAAEKCGDPPAATPCGEARPPLSETRGNACGDPRAATPLGTTYLTGAALEGPTPRLAEGAAS